MSSSGLDRMFSGCDSLTSVTFPDSLELLGNYVFDNCNSLTQVYFEGDAPTQFGDNVFGNPSKVIDTFVIYYNSKKSGWTTPMWNGYKCYPKVPAASATAFGDVNGDEYVTPLDRLLLTRYLAGWSGYEERIDLSAADINKDGKVSAMDRLILSRYLAKWSGYDQWFKN